MHPKVGEAQEKMHKAVLHMQDEFAGNPTAAPAASIFFAMAAMS